MDQPKRTELQDLGEFGLIKRLTEKIELRNKSSIKGVGDDAAVVHHEGKHTVVTTDMLLENIHFDLTYTPLLHLGYKAVVVNLSDVFAMNAIPKQITVSIALSNRFSIEAVDELYKGIYHACDIYGVDVIGGDTTSSVSGLIISITCLGEANPEKIVSRSGASENEILCVSGDLGSAYIGLQILEREKQIFKEAPEVQPDLDGNDYVIERILKPEARKDIIDLLAHLDILPTSMIDISDGLASELLHLCKASGVGCQLQAEKIPIDPATVTQASNFNIDPTVCALNGGEDYELLFTIRQADYDKLKDSPDITFIGFMTDASMGCKMTLESGSQIDLESQGWDSFTPKSE